MSLSDRADAAVFLGRVADNVKRLFSPVELRCRSVGLPVGFLLTSVHCAKTANLIEMPFVVVGWAGPRNHY